MALRVLAAALIILLQTEADLKFKTPSKIEWKKVGHQITRIILMGRYQDSRMNL